MASTITRMTYRAVCNACPWTRAVIIPNQFTDQPAFRQDSIDHDATTGHQVTIWGSATTQIPRSIWAEESDR